MRPLCLIYLSTSTNKCAHGRHSMELFPIATRECRMRAAIPESDARSRHLEISLLPVTQGFNAARGKERYEFPVGSFPA